MDDHRTGSMHKDDVAPWPSRVPPGVPGAGWFVVGILTFSIFIFTGWSEGWWQGNYTAAAPAAPHHTTGSGNKVQQ